MGDHEARGDDFEKKAEKKLSGWGLFSSKYEDAADLFDKAANSFKLAKNWSRAASVYIKIANCHLKGDSKHEAASAYVEAANCYKKFSPQEAVQALNQSVNLFLEIGRLNMAARYSKDIGEIYQQEQDLEKATDYLERAADLFDSEGQSSQSNTIKQKVAEIAAQLEQNPAYSRRARALLPWRASAEPRSSLASGNRQSNAEPFDSMEASAETPTRPSNPATASPSPSNSLSLRQWRPAAQRNMRNQWSYLKTAKEKWLDAAAEGRSHASALVNTHFTRRNMPVTDLGVLKDMPGIRDKANSKLARREEQYSGMLLSAYKEMVRQLSYLVKASHSMRSFSKATPNFSIMDFSECQDDLNDSGDGGGVPVFKWFSILEFESLAQELVEMFVSEQNLKRLLLLGFLSITLNDGVEHQTSLDWGDELYDGESNELQSIGLQSGDTYQLPENWSADFIGSQQPGNPPSHEVLQVYLTTWLTNMNINLSRIDEIFELVKEEMETKRS